MVTRRKNLHNQDLYRKQTVETRGRPLPEIYGKVKLLNKTPSIDGCERNAGCGGIKLSII
jgi:hypothetical protein